MKSIALILALLAPSALAATLVVDGDDNIFGAGHSTPPAPYGVGAGTLPPSFQLAAVSYAGSTYFDNLDGLGTSTSWTNDSTLPGWFAYQSGDGNVVLPGRAEDSWQKVSALSRSIGQQQTGLLNLGNDNANPNRSLGTKNSAYDIVFALVLRNDSALTFTDFTLSYFGEQWQISAPSSDPSMKLDFTYGVFSSFSDLAANPNTIVPHNPNDPDQFGRFNVGYIDPASGALDFAAFRFDNTQLPLNGNDPANRQLVSSTQPVVWAPGQFLVMRWFDDYTAGKTAAMLAVNDVQFSANVPEPATAVSLLLGLVILASRRERLRFPFPALGVETGNETETKRKRIWKRAAFTLCARKRDGNEHARR